jgi:hypothetical protein
MTSIKIECGCGQRYAFDVDPHDGRMPHTVACPVCGTDGTGAANDVIAQTLQPLEVAAAPRVRVHLPTTVSEPPVRLAESAVHIAPSAPAVHVAAAPAAPRTTHTRTVLLPGQTDPTQVAHEARAKIFWGDPPLEVLKFLMINNIPRAEATEIVRELTAERVVQMRKNGMIKIFTGVLMVCVPVAGWFIFNAAGIIPMKLFAIMIMLGLWGAYRVLKGTFMVVAPKAQAGDVSEQ